MHKPSVENIATVEKTTLEYPTDLWVFFQLQVLWLWCRRGKWFTLTFRLGMWSSSFLCIF